MTKHLSIPAETRLINGVVSTEKEMNTLFSQLLVELLLRKLETYHFFSLTFAKIAAFRHVHADQNPMVNTEKNVIEACFVVLSLAKINISCRIVNTESRGYDQYVCINVNHIP